MKHIVNIIGLLFVFCGLGAQVYERPIVIITASYNNTQWAKSNLDSIFNQKYNNYYLIYVDDYSQDGTGKFVQDYIKERGFEKKVRLFINGVRMGALANQYNAIHLVPDNAIIIILDGDDLFAHDQVLNKINQVYSDPAIWLTYGQFVEFPSNAIGFCCEYPEHIVKENKFREYGHTPSHLRTYYAWLFKQIKKEDLMFEGDFFVMDGDIATMFPMIEMAREGHFRFVPDVLCRYNAANPINDYKVSKALQVKLDQEIRSRKRYDAFTVKK